MTDKPTKKPKTICVFCGSSRKSPEKYLELGFQCGAAVAAAGYNMLYGGSCNGVMKAVADGAISRGGYVIGVFPQSIFRGLEMVHPGVNEIISVADLEERKREMVALSDAFITLPGGYGTLDEFFEVVTLRSVRAINKPSILLNYQGFWDKLLDMVTVIEQHEFTHGRPADAFVTATTIAECMEKLLSDI